MRDRNRDTALTLFRGLIDLIEWREWVDVWELVVKHFGDRCSKSGLTVIDVSNGADIHVRLCPLELCLCHDGPPVIWLTLLLGCAGFVELDLLAANFGDDVL
jgi:hypothetical protein